MRGILLILCAAITPGIAGQAPPPLADHHQHLFSPSAAALMSAPPSAFPVKPITASDLVPLLDSAGMRRAVVLSVAYMYGNPNRRVENEYEKVRAENDWTSREVARFPDRLIAFCSLNPLKPYALEELARCAQDPRLRAGLKLHFGNSDVDVNDPEQLTQVRRVFAAANSHRMAIVVHMRASITLRRPYGRGEARLFLNELLAAAPDVPVQIAHLAGAGGYTDTLVDQAVEVFAEAIASQDPRTSNLWFDVTSVPGIDLPADRVTRLVERIRRLGVQRLLFGSDAAVGSNLRPREAWAEFRQLPLTDEEFRTIASNVPPYMR